MPVPNHISSSELTPTKGNSKSQILKSNTIENTSILEFGHWNLGFTKLVLQKSIMQYLKNVLFVAIFALCSLGLKAAAPLSFSSTQITVNAPQIDGVISIVQGRSNVKVDVTTTGLVALTVLNSEGEVVYQRNLQAQTRRASINTNNFANGTYTLLAEAAEGIQELSFAIGEDK